MVSQSCALFKSSWFMKLGISLLPFLFIGCLEDQGFVEPESIHNPGYSLKTEWVQDLDTLELWRYDDEGDSILLWRGVGESKIPVQLGNPSRIRWKIFGFQKDKGRCFSAETNEGGIYELETTCLSQGQKPDEPNKPSRFKNWTLLEDTLELKLNEIAPENYPEVSIHVIAPEHGDRDALKWILPQGVSLHEIEIP